MESNTGTRWSSYSKYVDIDTGEIVKLKDVLNKNYIIIKRDKYVKLNQLKTSGIIEYTNLVRRNPQGKLNFN